MSTMGSMEKARFACFRYAEAYALVLVSLKLLGELRWGWLDVLVPVASLYAAMLLAALVVRIVANRTVQETWRWPSVAWGIPVALILCSAAIPLWAASAKHELASKPQKVATAESCLEMRGMDGVVRVVNYANFRLEEEGERLVLVCRAAPDVRTLLEPYIEQELEPGLAAVAKEMRLAQERRRLSTLPPPVYAQPPDEPKP